MTPDTPRDTSRLSRFSVGGWLVEPKACTLSRAGTVVRLRPQLIDLLVCLARRAGEIVLRDEILSDVWAGQYVAESGLSRCVAELRQSLQDVAQGPRFIETIPRRGYRIIAPVVWLDVAREHQPAPALRAEPRPDAPGQARADLDPLERAEAILSASPAPATGLPAAPPAGRGWRRWAVAATVGLAAIAIVTIAMLVRSRASVLTDRDAVVLAFENRAGDAVFDEAIPLAMSIQLEQSPYLRLLSRTRIEETLGMMQRPPDTPLTPLSSRATSAGRFRITMIRSMTM